MNVLEQHKDKRESGGLRSAEMGQTRHRSRSSFATCLGMPMVFPAPLPGHVRSFQPAPSASPSISLCHWACSSAASILSSVTRGLRLPCALRAVCCSCFLSTHTHQRCPV